MENIVFDKYFFLLHHFARKMEIVKIKDFDGNEKKINFFNQNMRHNSID
jgi:hypothetical protein